MVFKVVIDKIIFLVEIWLKVVFSNQKVVINNKVNSKGLIVMFFLFRISFIG